MRKNFAKTDGFGISAFFFVFGEISQGNLLKKALCWILSHRNERGRNYSNYGVFNYNQLDSFFMIVRNSATWRSKIEMMNYSAPENVSTSTKELFKAHRMWLMELAGTDAETADCLWLKNQNWRIVGNFWNCSRNRDFLVFFAGTNFQELRKKHCNKLFSGLYFIYLETAEPKWEWFH